MTVCLYFPVTPPPLLPQNHTHQTIPIVSGATASDITEIMGWCMHDCVREWERERHVYVYSSCLQRPFLDKGYDSIHVRKQEGKNNRLCRCSVWPKLITLSHAHTRHVCHHNQTQAKPIHSHVNQYKMGELETKYLRYQMYYDGFIFIPFWGNL